ncbi:TRM11 family SAM-dependent methyltransferase [Streptomyces kaempferi]
MNPCPLSVWNTAPTSAPAQRADRYVPGSAAHPAKMLPAIAAHAITTYTKPGDLVLDPMCGIGTTLVEAVHLGRHALGAEYEPEWAELADQNLRHADAQGAPGTGAVYRGDARAHDLDPGSLPRPRRPRDHLTSLWGERPRPGPLVPRDRRTRRDQEGLPLQP